MCSIHCDDGLAYRAAELDGNGAGALRSSVAPARRGSKAAPCRLAYRRADRRRRGQSRLVAKARVLSSRGRRPSRVVGALCGTAHAFGVQLPRRRQHAGGTRRGGCPSRPACHRADRSRRTLRSGAFRRGRQGTGRCRRCSAPSCRWAGETGPRTPIRRGRICWCWPAVRRDTDGCHASSRKRIWRVARRASCATTTTR